MNRKQRRAAARQGAPTNAEALYRRGLAHHQGGAVEDAIAAYTEAVATDPSHDSAWGNMGAAQASLGMMAVAHTSLERAAAAPRSATAHSNLGHLIYRLDDPAGAIFHLERSPSSQTSPWHGRTWATPTAHSTSGRGRSSVTSRRWSPSPTWAPP